MAELQSVVVERIHSPGLIIRQAEPEIRLWINLGGMGAKRLTPDIPMLVDGYPGSDQVVSGGTLKPRIVVGRFEAEFNETIVKALNPGP